MLRSTHLAASVLLFASPYAYAYNVTIGGSSTTCSVSAAITASADCAITASDLEAQLSSGDVSISTGGDGSIVLADTLSWSAHKLSLNPQNGSIYAKLGSNRRFIGKAEISGSGAIAINGTDYTVITDATALQNIQSALDGHYVLGSDIDLQGVSWTPIGTFTGVFDGLGHEVRHLTLSGLARSEQGLFGKTNGATLQNVGVTDVAITGGAYDWFGALVGYNEQSTVARTYASGSVSGEGMGYGGIAGANMDSVVKSSFAHIAVSAGVNGRAGTVVGFNRSYNGTAIVADCYGAGKIAGGYNVGGTVGTTDDAVQNAFAVATVTGEYQKGGVVFGSSSNSFYDNTVNTDSSMNDTSSGKSTAQMKTLSTYSGAGWDIAGVDGNYPMLTFDVDHVWTMVPNNVPVITESSPQAITMSEDGAPTPFSLTLHATDADNGDTLTWSIWTAPAHGTASVSGTPTGTSQAIGYAPQSDYFGSDSFVVRVDDGNLGFAFITVNVTVESVNDAPVITSSALTTATLNTPYSYIPVATDADGDALIWSEKSGTQFPAWLSLQDVVRAEPVGSAGFTQEGATNISMVIDGSGTPYVAFKDAHYWNGLTVMKYDGTAWVGVGNPGISNGSPNFISLAIDGNGNLYVAYEDETWQYEGHVKRYDGNGWMDLGGWQGFSTTGAAYVSLAFDSSNIPYVAYKENVNNKTVVKKYDSNSDSFVAVGDEGFSAGEVNYVSLAIHDTTPYVAYADWGNSGFATVMKYNGSAWENVGSAGFSGYRADFVSLALDSSGNPYVAYQDYRDTDYKATVMAFDGSAWNTVGSAGFSGNDARQINLKMHGDTPYVSYSEQGLQIKLMRYESSTWQSIDTGTFSPGSSTVSLALDSSGNPMIAFSDVDQSFKATVIAAVNKTALAGTPTTAGVYDVNLSVSDRNGGEDVQSFQITVACEGGNCAPTAIHLSNDEIIEGNAQGALIGILSATDADVGDTHTYSLTCNDANFSVTSDGNLSADIALVYDDTPSQSVCVQVSDGTATYEQNLTITILAKPRTSGVDFDTLAPTLDAKNNSYDLSFSVTDPDGDTLSVSVVSSDPSLVSVSPASQNVLAADYGTPLSFTLAKVGSATGTAKITVTVSGPTGESVNTFDVTVAKAKGGANPSILMYLLN